MRAITKSEYNLILSRSDEIINRKQNIPDKVFHKEFKIFLFITFDEILMPIFFNHLKKYLVEINQKKLWVTTIKPDPKNYFEINFDFWGAFEIRPEDNAEDYIAALHNYPTESPADAIAHSANSILFFSPEHDWAIYGDRDSDIAICSFNNKEKMQIFQAIYGYDLLGSVKDAAIYAYGEEENIELKKHFFRSFSTN